MIVPYTFYPARNELIPRLTTISIKNNIETFPELFQVANHRNTIYYEPIIELRTRFVKQK